MKAGVSTACLYPALLEDSLSDLVKNGIRNTEIFVNTHCELKPQFINMLKNILTAENSVCTALHPYTCPIEPMMLFSTYERRINDALDYCKYYFEAMNMLGAKVFVLHGNKSTIAVEDSLYFERFVILSEAAEKFGITVAQENVARCQSRSLSFLKKMSDSLGDRAKFVFDVKQAIRSDEDPFTVARTLGNKIIHVHISDSNTENDCMLLGKGGFDIKALLSLLGSEGFDGSVMLELYRSNFSDISELVESYNYLKAIINEI